MVFTPDKCHFIALGDPNYICNLTCNGTTIECSKEEKLLGVTIDDKITFTSYIGNIIMKTKQRLHAQK